MFTSNACEAGRHEFCSGNLDGLLSRTRCMCACHTGASSWTGADEK